MSERTAKRWAWLALIPACGGGDKDPLTASTSFTVTSVAGAGTSPLDPLLNQPVDIDVVWSAVDFNHGGGNDPPGCRTTIFVGPTSRTSNGSSAQLVQQEILDRLPNWDVRLQLCDPGSGTSSVSIDAVINELNLTFGCSGVATQIKDSAGYPALTTFSATTCSATILDVVNNRVLSSDGFAIAFATGPEQLP